SNFRMYCASCGKEFHSADDTFCRYCGKQRYVLPETGAASRAKTPDVSSELKQATKKLAA
ncbi:MAG TPA: hypothetical protein VN739_00615, partial [Nitrososphaerales archaeon]|nr:hypothetical protein [Nitrososphaerales archaeon]